MADELLAGRRAIVTGGGGGIGSAVVAGLHASGAAVAAVGRSASVHHAVVALPREAPSPWA